MGVGVTQTETKIEGEEMLRKIKATKQQVKQVLMPKLHACNLHQREFLIPTIYMTKHE